VVVTASAFAAGAAMSARVLAVDQGTTSTKALIVDDEGRTLATSSATFPQYFPQPGWVEHDAQEIWASVVLAVERALDEARLRARDLTAIGLTNQRETVVMWDRHTGVPVSRAIVWQDRRTAATCEALRRVGVEDWVTARTGLRVDPYFSATKIAWLLDHHPEARERARRGEIAVGTIDSWLLWKLTGGRVYATDVTNAARTLVMDLSSMSWDEDLCHLFHVPREALARIDSSEGVFGDTDRQVWGASVPVTGVLGDQQAALLGQGCVAPGQTKSTYGTGSFVLQHTGNVPAVTSRALVATAACTEGGAPGQYALEGSVFATGASIQWLRDGLGIIDNVAQSEAMAASVADNGDVWFVPAFSGLGSPEWDPHARGLLIGVTRGTTSAHVARAALESIAYQIRDVVDAMTDCSGHPFTELKVDGGATSNHWLMQFQSDVLGVPVVVCPHPEATSWGAVYAAGVGARVWASHDHLPGYGAPSVRYEPMMSVDQRDHLQSRWRRAVARSQGWAL
jgi:glycerol kinase